MTLEDISNSVPNGFHDTEIRSINIDYLHQTMSIDCTFWIGQLGESSSETYRKAQVIISGLLFCQMEPPRELPRHYGEGLIVEDFAPLKSRLKTADASSSAERSSFGLPATLSESLPADAFVHSFHVFDWDSHIHIAARDAHLQWTGEIEYRP